MAHESTDLLTPELREAEREIDTAYLLNPLVKETFAVSAWRIMAFFEDLAVMEFLKGPPGSIHESIAFADYIVNHVQYPLRWLYDSCPSGGDPPCTYNEDHYQHSKDLADLADGYEPFVSAFTYASRGIVSLELVGRTIRLTQPFYTDSRYDAYDWLIRAKPLLPDFSEGNILELVSRRVQISGEQFRYQLGRKFVQQCGRILSPIIEHLFELPDNWEFPRYSLSDFRAAAKTLASLGFIHYIAHIRAAMSDCRGGGYSSSLIIFSREDFVWKLARYADIDFDSCSAMIEDLTFGGRGIRHPDPALQPIIALNNNTYCLMPNLLASSAMERNLISLLNRIPSERGAYLRLVDHKENHMKDRAMSALTSIGLRFHSGAVHGWEGLPDIDLALISTVDRVVIVLELKWFIDPAEPREVIEKSDEISQGVNQLEILSEAFDTDPTQFILTLNIDTSYKVYWIVASQNSIGDERSQSDNIPVVNFDHLLSELGKKKDLQEVAEWVASKMYLPIEGKDYRVVPLEFDVNGWKLEWFGIEPLV